MFDKHKGSKQVGPETPEIPVSKPSPTVTPAPPPGSEKQTMIGRGISIAGDVTADSNLKVEGVIEGRSIESSHDVEIGESGKVTASITAKVVRIAGEVTGDVVGSEKVLISKSGRVHGNVAAPRVQLEDGALFRGSIDMNPTQGSAEAKPVAAARPSPAEVKTPAGKAAGPEAETRKEASLTLKSG
jgi:cytoskeletal protein CcmA (bactofilin family)